MKQLLESENELISKFENYLAEQEKQLDTLKLKVLEFKNENRKASEEGTQYFLNPINIFSFTRRLTNDWKEIEKYILNENFLGILQSFKKSSNFPTNTELISSAGALFWLQDIYNISTSSLVKGEINGIDYKTALTATDCFELGYKAYKKEDFYHSTIWMNEALNNLIVNDVNLLIKERILEILAESYFKMGDVNSAVTISNEFLKLTNDSLSQRSKEFYQRKTSDIIHENNAINEFPEHLYEDILQSDINYPELCQNVQNQNTEQSNYLNCQYENNNVPFLFIAPFKKEILNIDPILFIYHDVISDEEIKIIQEFVEDDLEYAKVYDVENNNDVTSSHRHSKHKWIMKNDIGLNIEKRAGDITGLDMKSSENLNINKYEIGGYYTPHYDYFANQGYAYDIDLNSTGNRISTLIFYLNDVKQGGATVFPSINISVQPKKGSAIFWFNLHSSGEFDPRTLHGACPVLAGSHKWILTIWTHEKFQDIYRPCIDEEL